MLVFFFIMFCLFFFFFFSSRRRHTRYIGDWSSDVCSSDLESPSGVLDRHALLVPVVAAGRADAVRALQVTAARTGLERDRRRLVMRAARALLPLGSPSFRYGHEIVLFSRGACP